MTRHTVGLSALLLAVGASLLQAGEVLPSRASARAIAVPSRDIELVSEVTGVIREVLVKEGDRVEKGQPVIHLDTDLRQSTLAISAQRAKSTARVEAAKANLSVKEVALKRQQLLLKKGVASQANLDEAQLEFEYAQAQLEVATEERLLNQLEVSRDRKMIDKMTLHAPVTGLVYRTLQDVGEGADDYRPLLQIVVVDVLHVLAHVEPEVAEQLKPGMEATFIVDAKPDEKHTCRVLVADRVIDAASGTIRVKLELDNREGKVSAGCRGIVHFDLAGQKTAAAGERK